MFVAPTRLGGEPRSGHRWDTPLSPGLRRSRVPRGVRESAIRESPHIRAWVILLPRSSRRVR